MKDEFILEREEDVTGFLGLQIERDVKTSQINLTQMVLIVIIIEVIEIHDSSPKFTPDKVPLCKYFTGESCSEEWNYISIVGIIIYLAGSNRPDIVYTVHYCAHFSRNHRRSHEIGLTHIARCLKLVKDKGLIMHPNPIDFKLGLFADADFLACLHQRITNILSVSK